MKNIKSKSKLLVKIKINEKIIAAKWYPFSEMHIVLLTENKLLCYEIKNDNYEVV